MQENELLKITIDLVCLAYHEIRNIRHPIKKGQIHYETRFQRIRDLPTNRQEAWLTMTKVRDKAALAKTAAEIASLFQKEYLLSLDDLLELYSADFWRDSAYGGNQWVPITLKIQELIKMVDAGNRNLAVELAGQLLEMRHNTGATGKKLESLRTAGP